VSTPLFLADLNRTMLRLLVTAGIVLSAGTIGCVRPAADSHAPTVPTGTVRIGVAESETQSGDVGFKQIWRLFTLEALTARGPDGRPQGRIAQSWDVSKDFLTWQIHLRPNVTFHDGTPLDAAAVKHSLEAVLARPNATALYPGMVEVRELSAAGPHTLVISLSRPSAFLIDDLDILLSKEAPNPDAPPIGTGPFKVVAQSATEVTLEAHEKYHLGPPAIREVVAKSYPTLRQAWSSLLRGEIDAMWNVSADALEFIESDNVDTFPVTRHYAHVIVFNSARPQLRPAGVRRALNAAIDRQALIQNVLKGRAQLADSPVWPNHWAQDNSVRGYSYDPSLAEATLDALGVELQPAGGATVPARMRFKCIVPQGHAVHERLALMVQRQLYDVGVDMQLESRPLTEMDAMLRGGDFDAAILDLSSGPTFSRVYQFWRSRGEFQGLNIFGYKNTQADKWLDRLRFAQDDASTRMAASQLQRVLMEDPPALFLAWIQGARAVSRRIEVPAGPGRDPILELWRWRIRHEPVVTEQ
jgi:peptide/nickel transport system substrate-binding protein